MGWVDIDLGCSTILPKQYVATVAAHQPGELTKSKSTQPCYQSDVSPCRGWQNNFPKKCSFVVVKIESAMANGLAEVTSSILRWSLHWSNAHLPAGRRMIANTTPSRRSTATASCTRTAIATTIPARRARAGRGSALSNWVSMYTAVHL